MTFQPTPGDDLTKVLAGPGHIFYTPDLSTLRLPPPGAPVPTTASSGGTVAAGVYQVAVSYVNAFGETLASAIGSVTTTGSVSTLTVPSPPAALVGQAGVAIGWYAYVSQVGGTAMTRQQAVGVPTAIGTPLTLTAPPTSTGAPAPLFGTAWDTSGALPQKIDDVVGLTFPYNIKAPWVYGGALSRDNVSAVRNIATNTVTTAHENIPVAQRVSNTSRTLQIPFQEVRPEIRALAENAPGVETIAQGAAASGTPAQSRVRMGAIIQLIRRRVVVIVERDPGVTGVTVAETGGTSHGQLYAWAAFNVALSAQATNVDMHPDNAVSQALQFDLYPEPLAPDVRYSHGMQLFETGILVP